MVDKLKDKVPEKKRGTRHSKIAAKPSEGEAMTKARNVISPTVRGALTTQAFAGLFGQTDLQAMVDALSEQNKRVMGGDLNRAEAMLTTQANSLDAIFNELSRRAAVNMSECIHTTERYLRLALKAQSQCRATLDTLAAIKNPPVIYAGQTNIAHGPQQINNGSLPGLTGGEISIEPNKLLEHSYEER